MFVFFTIFSFAQNTQIDSLKQEIKKPKQDHFLDYKALTLLYINVQDVGNTKKYAEQALDCAIRSNNKSYMASAKILISWNYIFKSDFNNALKTLDQAFQYAVESKDKKVQFYVVQSKILVYGFKGENKYIVFEIEKAIKILETINASKEYEDDLIILYLQKAMAYIELGMFDEAKSEMYSIKKSTKNNPKYQTDLYLIEYQLYAKMRDYKKAIKVCEQLVAFLKSHEIKNEAATLLSTYINMADFYILLNDVKKSNHYLNLALNLKQPGHYFTNLTVLRPYIYSLRSKNKLREGRFDEAHMFSDSAIFYSKANQDQKILAGAYNQKAAIFSEQKKFAQSIVYNKLAGNLFKEIGIKSDELITIHELLKAYISTNNSKQANLTFDRYAALKDSIFSEQVAQSITATEIKYQSELKESKIKTQQLQIQKEKSNKNIALSGIAFILLIGLSGFWTYRNKQNQRRLKTQNTLLGLQQLLVEAELSKLNQQLDPHEIKNLLASIAPEIQEKAPESYRKMLKLFNITKASLNSSSITDSLGNQLQQIDDYLSLEQGMLNIPLQYAVHNTIAELQTQLPRLLLKNLVENAVKHGIKQQENGGQITVDIKTRDAYYCVTIDDTGKGRVLANASTSGIGTTIYQKLFATLNLRNKEQAMFEIIDKPQGTTVKVQIPISYRYSS